LTEAVPKPAGGRLSRGALSWAVFEGGRDPFIILVTIYIYMPYVAATLVGDPVRGQEMISRWDQYIGWIVMATAPLLGASVDKLGPRKGWLALCVALMVPLIGAMWFAAPGGAFPLAALMLCMIGARVLFAYTEVLHNALLIRAAGMADAHRASGLALSLGNGFSVIALAFTAWAFALPGNVDWSWVPERPLFGLDTAAHEHERIVAPMAAVLLALGSIPILLWTPDAPRTGVPLLRAFAEGAGELKRMVTTVGRYRDAVIYLISRMLFVDGMNAVLIYAGVLAVGVMKWGALEMLTYGILLSVLAVLGGYVGRWLDASIGPKNALRIEIFMSMLGLIAALTMTPTRILGFWAYDPATAAPVWDGPVFRTWPDVVFVLIGFSNAIFITAQYASSRTMLTRLTPPEQAGAFFGVYALSGVATAWLAPTLVNLGTRLTNTQQGGFATIIVLLALGLGVLAFVRGGGRTV
jgi:MFS transporter, UMF1 family